MRHQAINTIIALSTEYLFRIPQNGIKLGNSMSWIMSSYFPMTGFNASRQQYVHRLETIVTTVPLPDGVGILVFRWTLVCLGELTYLEDACFVAVFTDNLLVFRTVS